MSFSVRGWLRGQGKYWLLALIPVLAAGGALTYALFFDLPPRMRSGPFELTYEPLVLDSADPGRTTVGELEFLGGWRLRSPNKSFGGLSAMAALEPDRLMAVNDKSIAIWLPKPGTRAEARSKMLPMLDYPNPEGRYALDSESLVVDTETGKAWVGFEIFHRICRYSPGFREMEKCRDWPEMRKWPQVASLESMALLPDGRFVVIAEGAPAEREGRVMLIFAGDPVAADTPHPKKMDYIPPVGYDPTEAVALGGSKLLVLNRRATLYDGFTAVLTVIDVDKPEAGGVLPGRIVAKLAPPLLADNYEGMALEEKDGQRTLWVVSDDNFMFFQRTLLLQFALPADL